MRKVQEVTRRCKKDPPLGYAKRPTGVTELRVSVVKAYTDDLCTFKAELVPGQHAGMLVVYGPGRKPLLDVIFACQPGTRPAKPIRLLCGTNSLMRLHVAKGCAV
jgi:hypothetical protein